MGGFGKDFGRVVGRVWRLLAPFGLLLGAFFACLYGPILVTNTLSPTWGRFVWHLDRSWRHFGGLGGDFEGFGKGFWTSFGRWFVYLFLKLSGGFQDRFLEILGRTLRQKAKLLTRYILESYFLMLSFQVLSVVPAGQVATVDHKDKQLFTALAAAAQQRMKVFKSQDLANTSWAIATANHKHEQLSRAFRKAP